MTRWPDHNQEARLRDMHPAHSMGLGLSGLLASVILLSLVAFWMSVEVDWLSNSVKVLLTLVLPLIVWGLIYYWRAATRRAERMRAMKRHRSASSIGSEAAHARERAETKMQADRTDFRSDLKEG